MDDAASEVDACHAVRSYECNAAEGFVPIVAGRIPQASVFACAPQSVVVRPLSGINRATVDVAGWVYAYPAFRLSIDGPARDPSRCSGPRSSGSLGRCVHESIQAELVADALATAITTLPRQLTRSLTWDQGHEMAEHARLTVDTGVRVYFCDPPWQRGSNENTNGPLRQYLPRHVSLRTFPRPTSTASPPS